MFISEDGTVTGSVDVSRLGEVEPKTDEARAQHASLTRDFEQGRKQAEVDAARASQGERAVGINSTGRIDDEDDSGGGEKSKVEQKRDADRQQADAEKRSEGDQQAAAGPQDDAEVEQLRTEAESSGVAVDKRWGADRLRQEIAASRSATRKR